jgi:hypothetical protein
MGKKLVSLVAVVGAALFLGSGLALAVTTTVSGGAIDQVRVVRSNTEVLDQSPNSFSDITGASTNISIPATWSKGLILARFSAESRCVGASGVRGWCSVRLVLVNRATGQQVQLAPEDTDNSFAFDSTNSGAEGSQSWESHSMDRSLSVAPGNYTVKALFTPFDGANFFSVDDWSLTVERARSN